MKDVVGKNDRLAVGLNVVRWTRTSSHGEQDISGTDAADALGGFHGQPVRIDELRPPANEAHFIARQLILHYIGFALDHRSNPAEEKFHGRAHARALAVAVFPVARVKTTNGFAKRFRGNRSRLDANAADAALFLDYGNLLAEFGRLHSGALSSWSATDANQVVFKFPVHEQMSIRLCYCDAQSESGT